MSTKRSAAEAYDHWAGDYDDCNAENDYELWLGETLLPRLEDLGLEQGRALDIGCGTGRAFAPLLKRGWQVVGCDASAGMLDTAEQKFGKDVQLFHCDARELSEVRLAGEGGAFSLVLMLNDVINYLTDSADLRRVFAGIKANLKHDEGLAVFDANARALFERDYNSHSWGPVGDTGWEWRGVPRENGDRVYQGELRDPDGVISTHVQRHWSRQEIEDGLEEAGLRCLTAYGQHEDSDGIRLSSHPSETGEMKIVYFVGHPSKG